MSTALRFGLPAAAVCLCTGCSIDIQGGEDAVVREQQRFAVASPAEVEVSTFDGSIQVRSWDRDEVLVEIERRAGSRADAEALEVRTSQQGSRVVVEAVAPERRDTVGLGRSGARGVHLVVTTPRRVMLRARSGDGPIAAEQLAGTIALTSGDGPVRAERLEGTITVNTGDGPMTLRDLDGTVEVSTGDGAVEITGRLDRLVVNTGDGPVRIEARPGSRVTQEWTVSTGDGPIALRLPPGVNAELDARTGDGPVSAVGLSNEVREDHAIRGRLGSGGPLIRLRTGDGPVAISN